MNAVGFFHLFGLVRLPSLISGFTNVCSIFDIGRAGTLPVKQDGRIGSPGFLNASSSRSGNLVLLGVGWVVDTTQ